MIRARRLTPLVGLALAAGAMAGATAGQAAQAVPAPFCTAGQLSVTVRPGSPGAGQRYATVILRNKTVGIACRIRGYVGLGLLGHGGRTVPTDAVRDQSRPARMVLLRPGQRAAASLHWTAISGTGEPVYGACEPTPVRLQVTPPDARMQLLTAWSFGPVCLHGRIDIRPLTRG